MEHDLFRPAFARRSVKRIDKPYQGFAQAGNRYPLFGIMLKATKSERATPGISWRPLLSISG
jgi:hypothetical protein